VSPENITAGTDKRLNWICAECSHEWSANGYSRASGAGCPACANKVIHIDGRNSMRSTHPNLTAELHPTKNGDVTPDNLIAGSDKRLIWVCAECSGEWEATLNNRTSNLSGCPMCTKKTQRELFNIVTKLFPDNEVKWDYKHPKLRFSGSGKKMELDIWVPHLKLGIEYQGEQHFMPKDHWGGKEEYESIKKRDAEKREACRKTGIRLIEVHYSWDRTKESIVEMIEGENS
jgi:DNA-directed RNA polymerase subunit RPC12/RpoP